MNLFAVFELVPAALIGSAVWWMSGKHDVAALLCCGILLLAADLALRGVAAVPGAISPNLPQWSWERCKGKMFC